MITKMSQTCRLAAVGVDGVNSGIEVLPIHRHQEGDDLANADRLRRSIGERLVLLVRNLPRVRLSLQTLDDVVELLVEVEQALVLDLIR